MCVWRDAVGCWRMVGASVRLTRMRKQRDLALAAVKFYSRALSQNEVEEMYRGGQVRAMPLSRCWSACGLT